VSGKHLYSPGGFLRILPTQEQSLAFPPNYMKFLLEIVEYIYYLGFLEFS